MIAALKWLYEQDDYEALQVMVFIIAICACVAYIILIAFMAITGQGIILLCMLAMPVGVVFIEVLKAYKEREE